MLFHNVHLIIGTKEKNTLLGVCLGVRPVPSHASSAILKQRKIKAEQISPLVEQGER